MSSPPLLMDITVDGKPIKAVADAHQDGHALCLRPHHRQAGLADPGKEGARRATCRANGMRRPSPFPSKPAPYARTGVVGRRADRFHAGAARRRRWSWSRSTRWARSTPRRCCPSPTARIATFMAGPGQWRHQLAGRLLQSGKPHRLCLCLQCLPVADGLVPPPPGMTDLPYVEGQAGQQVVMVNAAGADQGADAPPRRKRAAARRAAGGGGGFRSLTVQACRWSSRLMRTISAINLDKRRHRLAGRRMATRPTTSATIRRSRA